MDTSTKLRRPDTTFAKPNELLVMVPMAGKLSPVARKLFNELLFAAGNQYRARLNSGSPMLATERFEARMSDLVARFPGEASDWSRNAKQHIEAMEDIKVIWETTDRQAGISREGAFHLIEDRVFETRGNARYVLWKFPITILEILKDPAFFTRLDLEVIGSLRTYASIALYEICSRYKTNPSGVTCVQSPDWWVEALTARSLRASPPKPSSKTGASVELDEKPRREWRKVKSESVLDAIEEINTKTDLEIDLIERRTGKAVTEVQFSVRRKRKAIPAGQGIAPDILEKGVSLGIGAGELSTIARAVRGGPDVLRAGLKKLEDRASRDDLPPLSNATAYLKTILGELDEYVQLVDDPGPATTITKAPVAASTGQGSRNVPEVVDVVETPESLAKKHIEALNRPTQEALASAAIERMQAKGMATPSVMHAYAKYLAGGPLAGVLLGEMTRQYLATSPSEL